MNIIDKVMQRAELLDEPPVLIDIGASGGIHAYWKRIAKYSVCIAFDADDRDFQPVEKTNGDYRKLFVYNRILSTKTEDENDFYLTRSPHCSSLLKPNEDGLKNWAYAKKFEVEKKVQLKSVDLISVLAELRIEKIDWYKSDSQGIDLKLFKSLDEKIRNQIIVAEFEPGILDAYQGEDKLHHVLSYMDQSTQYWLSRLTLKGTQRIAYKNLKSILKNDFLSEVSPYVNKTAPGWGEMVFINTFENLGQAKRDLLLGWVLSTLQSEHGFAYQLAITGMERFEDALFVELKNFSALKVRMGMISLKYFPLIFRTSSKFIRKMMYA
jgi:FkbM family methyltransferase